jgi:hypothetical protein
MRRRPGSWLDQPRPFTIDVQAACDQVKRRWSAVRAFEDSAS